MRKNYLFVLLLLMPFGLSAQIFELGLFGGGSYYLGDLNPGKHFLMTKPAYGALIRYNQTTRWAYRGSLYFGNVTADDYRSEASLVRGLNFESRIIDVALTVEFNFLDFFRSAKRNIMSPYIFGGIGIFLFNPKSGDVQLVDIGTEGQKVNFDGRAPYDLWTFSFPFGLGFKYNISKRLTLAVEWGMRKGYSDYVDDVSKTYYLNGADIDPSLSTELLSDPTMLHEPYEQRGNPKYDDWINFTGVSLSYKFSPFLSRKCFDQTFSRVK
jgi:hypothetical protein